MHKIGRTIVSELPVVGGTKKWFEKFNLSGHDSSRVLALCSHECKNARDVLQHCCCGSIAAAHRLLVSSSRLRLSKSRTESMATPNKRAAVEGVSSLDHNGLKVSASRMLPFSLEARILEFVGAIVLKLRSRVR